MRHPSVSSLPVAAHRPDIEGLRGIAVLSVFAVHAIPQALRGGFIGVDVFFVLSGYLIGSITLAEMAAGRFNAIDFYARRMRRLLPALLVVLLACTCFAALVAFPKDAQQTGKHALGGAAFAANLVLWREAGYFDPASDTKPLLHLWSLGVEAQFYLLWPLLALLMRRSGRWRVAILATLTLASFALNIVMVADKPKGTFFLPPTRFWEMLLGVLLASWYQRRPGGPLADAARWLRLAPGQGTHRALANAFATLGVLLLLGAMWWVDKTDHFPGWWALMPTLATGLLLAAGMQAWVNRVLLAEPVLMFYGRISYPLYLWHWPLLTFPRLLGHPLGTVEQVGLLCLSVGLAALTYHAVEKPLRAGLPARRAFGLLLPALGLTAALGGVLWATDGLLVRYPDEVRAIASAQVHTDYADYRVERCFLRSEQTAGDFAADCVERGAASRPLMLLWGDSHAAALYPGLHTLLTRQAASPRVAQYTSALCPPLLRSSIRHSGPCAEVNRFVLEQVRREHPATVVLAGHWARYQAPDDEDTTEIDSLIDTVAKLRALGVARVVVVGPLPQWQVDQPRLLLAEWSRSGRVAGRGTDGFVGHAVTVDRQLRAISLAAGAEYISPLELLCDPTGCETTVNQGGILHALAFDESHLTTVGSRRLAEAMRPQLLR